MAPREQARRGSGARAGGGDELSLGTDKLYFKIGEVAEIVGVAPHVLRYWETEFAALRPRKSRTQQRVYRRRDVATLLRIKHLLYVDKFTIAGARKQLREAPEACPLAEPSPQVVARHSLSRVRSVLDELQALVDAPGDPSQADPAAYLRRQEPEGDSSPAPASPGLAHRPPRGAVGRHEPR
ncbi:MAG: MerR family transcriptional regulator [Myxococcales bacterium]|nr:MerR family transcriptional regulator [Myxococcales bacterium]